MTEPRTEVYLRLGEMFVISVIDFEPWETRRLREPVVIWYPPQEQ